MSSTGTVNYPSIDPEISASMRNIIGSPMTWVFVASTITMSVGAFFSSQCLPGSNNSSNCSVRQITILSSLFFVGATSFSFVLIHLLFCNSERRPAQPIENIPL